MAKELVSRLIPAEAIQWGPGWADMMKAAEELGAHGLMFQIKTLSEEEERRGIDILPELWLYDHHYLKHVVHPGRWVLILPGWRRFRVVDTEDIRREYHEVEELEDAEL